MTVEAEPLTSGPAALRLPARATEARGLGRGRVWGLLIVDLVAVVLALAGTYVAADRVGTKAPFIAPAGVLATLAVAMVAMWPAVFGAYGLYERQTRAIAPSSLDEVADLFHALLAGTLVLLVIGQVVKTALDALIFSPIQAAVFVGFTLILIPLGRSCLRTWVLPS